jgi:dTDP-4-amino-4,6-dideoxygalactose transaminase
LHVPFYVPFIDDVEANEVVSTIESNWLSKGPKTVEFEKKFVKSVESTYGVALNSCTAGLHLAQLVSGIGPGDEVITTPYTFTATANTILHCGAKPVFVDIDPVTLNINTGLIEQRITSRTKAIIPVHFAGYPCEMDPIMELARQHNLIVIEDAAHAVYTKYKGRPIGSIGDVSCFSFYATKNLTTGEGGMITTNHHDVAERIRLMSLHGMSRNAWNRYSNKGSWFYEVEEVGFKYNMTDIQAAIGLVQLEKLDLMQHLRAKHARKYTELLSDCEELILPFESEEHRHAWHLYPIRLELSRIKVSRNEMIEKLAEAGVNCSVHFIPVPEHPVYRKLGYRLEDYPATAKAFDAILSLPLYPGLTDEQVQYVANSVTSLVMENRR